MKRFEAMVVRWTPFIPRFTLGILLIALGINHARNFNAADPQVSDFIGFITQPIPVWAAYPNVIPWIFTILGWIFVLLLLLTGVLILTKQFPKLAHAMFLKIVAYVFLWISVVIAFGTFEVSLQAMQFAMNPIIVLILYYSMLKSDTAAKR